MWSSSLEIYPVHVANTQAPAGQSYVIEPQVNLEYDYMIVRPPKAPYSLQPEYATRHWVC
jgi:hypothetical protein|tara:strand:+ start:390 stop:569 length:180 start_codon:yes stop_codon:yes gene_type:complete